MEKSIVNEVVNAIEAVKSYGQPGFWILLERIPLDLNRGFPPRFD